MESPALFATLVMLAICRAAHRDHLPGTRPLNIAHRGSSGALPEHTLEAYRLAIKDGADYIECDVCITKDLILVCRHESWLNESTNIWDNATLRSRQATYNVTSYDGVKTITDIFTVDLTLAELKSIRVKQKYSFRDPNFDDKFQIPTLEEYIEVAKSADREIGIYPELKTPEWFNSLDILKNANKTFEDLIVEVLSRHGYNKANSLCYVQSFSKESLRSLSTKTSLPLVMLYDTNWPLPNADSKFRDVSSFCAGIGVWKNMIIPMQNNYLQSTTALISLAQKYKLKVHAYTFRNENKYLAWNYTQDPYTEYETFLQVPIDGYFTDFPASLKKFLDMKYFDHPPCISGAHGKLRRGYSKLISFTIFCVMLSFL